MEYATRVALHTQTETKKGKRQAKQSELGTRWSHQKFIKRGRKTILVRKDEAGTIESIDVSMPCPILVE